MTQTAGTGSTPPLPSRLKRTERNCSRDLTLVLTPGVTSQANQLAPLLAHQERLIDNVHKNLSVESISHSQPAEKDVADGQIEPRPPPSVSLSSDYFKSRMRKQGSNKTDDRTLLMKQRCLISYYSQTEGVADKQSVPRPPSLSPLPKFQDLRLHEGTILLEDQKLYSIDAVGSSQIILPIDNNKAKIIWQKKMK